MKIDHLVSKTVYSLYYPDVESVITKILSEYDQSNYHNAYTKKQDEMHLSFMNKYKDWS